MLRTPFIGHRHSDWTAMPAFAAVLTLLPLALDIGQGAGMQQPLAIAVISGFVMQFPFSLLALPIMLKLLLGTVPAKLRRARPKM